MLVLADGPLAAVAGRGTPVAVEPRRTSMQADELRVLRVLVRGLQGQDAAAARSTNPHQVTAELEAFTHVVRPYAPALRKIWARALVAAGYPVPDISD